ncbi:unnamed protein product [Prorocentrum cordatum]|uniref:TM2 domain-containing protein n=1 Tax=Prorocentrum cordatum TaxID=2364126 RepID=A0ABN9TGK5_9DINO|nr:unnamed protein product [Polarella glacialis]
MVGNEADNTFSTPTLEWQCADRYAVEKYLGFCKGAIRYNPALPSPQGSSLSLDRAVIGQVTAQDDAAATMFFYHVTGMGYEAWEHSSPASGDDECMRSVWRLSCLTYFPKSQVGSGTRYHRPCAGLCEGYLEACAVECCDDSAGYVDEADPDAPECSGRSGGAALRAPAGLLLALLLGRVAAAAAAVLCAACLQGCEVEVPQHEVANWRKKDNYLRQYEYIPPGHDASSAVLNSCADETVDASLQCSGHGYCKTWNPMARDTTALSFCTCSRDWAGPECAIQRKSQTKVFLLSLFGGMLGLDYFYLGLPLIGLAKLLTLGGCGFWWLVDIVRTGAGPVYSQKHRVAADLPHSVFLLVTLTLFVLLGLAWSAASCVGARSGKRRAAARAGPEGRAEVCAERDLAIGAAVDFKGYGTTLAAAHGRGRAAAGLATGRAASGHQQFAAAAGGARTW